jgi:hypothetical protein
VDIVTAGGEDENHAWSAVQVNGAHDSWIRGVTALHFGYAGFRLDGAVRFTVENSKALDPVGIRTGSRFYNFSIERRSQMVLFTNCEASGARHSFISNGVSLSSGIVFHRSRQTGGGSEGGHRMWTQGILYDNITELSAGQVLLINRGDFGSSHGWGTAHSTIWKYDSEMLVQQPPTAQNYGISNAGHFRPEVYFPGPRGHEELRSGELVPFSLYEAQLCERLAGSPAVPVKLAIPGSAASASSDDGNVPANAVDGSLATRWSANGDGQWIQFDLAGARNVAFVKIAWYKGDTRNARFDVQLADAAAGPWRTVLAGAQSNGNSLALQTHDFPDAPGRHLRILGHGNTVNLWNSITEAEVWVLP